MSAPRMAVGGRLAIWRDGIFWGLGLQPQLLSSRIRDALKKLVLTDP